MRVRLLLMALLVSAAGCDVSFKNGLFACGQPSDCPSGYFCWSSDSRCYDSKEPECEPKSCEQVIAEFQSVGITIECGSLPDGCDGSIECGSCPQGTACGANGQNFICGCEESTCASYGGGVECGSIPTRCDDSEHEEIFCGDCPGDQLVCVDNQCVCPAGRDCEDECGDRCGAEEICVAGECCTPTYPCSRNECSPPGGLPDGCGGVANCPACSEGEDCVFTNDLVFQCVDDCTCEAQGIECGSSTICGDPTLCGTCADNGFGDGYRCENNRCVCKDQFEYNDDFDSFALVCGGATGVNCLQEAWSVDLQATFHDGTDVDLFSLKVLDAWTPIAVQAYDGSSRRALYVTYLCPDGYPGVLKCSGSTDTVQGIEFCVTDGDLVGLQRACETSVSGQEGMLLVGVEPLDFAGECDPYGLKIIATYGSEIEPY